MADERLGDDGQRLVKERIIAGDTNNEIRAALKDAGYPFDFSDQAFTRYRQSEEVREAIDRKDTEAIQSGYARRSERILKLAKSAKRLEKRLAAADDAEDFYPGEVDSLLRVHKEYRETIKDIGDLVDPTKAARVDIQADVKNAPAQQRIIVEHVDAPNAASASVAGAGEGGKAPV